MTAADVNVERQALRTEWLKLLDAHRQLSEELERLELTANRAPRVRLVGFHPSPVRKWVGVHPPPVRNRIHTLVFESRASADLSAEMRPWL